jgi:hypothetical protein
MLQHHARLSTSPLLSSPTTRRRRGVLPISKVSHLNRNTLRKVILKRGRVPPQKKSLSCSRIHVLSLFVVSRLYLPSSVDRSAGLAVVCVCVCVFFFLFGLMLICFRGSLSSLRTYCVSLTRTARASGYPRRSPGA